MHFAAKHFHENIRETEEGKNIGFSYFKERGFTLETIEKFELGYNLKSGQDIYLAAGAKQYNYKYLEELGLIKDYNKQYRDFFRGRVMFPIHNLSGNVIAFGGRTLLSDKKAPKYINSPENELYNKSKVLYGIFQAKHQIVKQDLCVLVEGYTDVLSMHQNGIEYTVASSGTALTTGQVKLIQRYTPNVCLLYDGDKAGIKAALRGLDLFLEQGMNIRIAMLPEDHDPDSFAQANSPEEIEKFLKEDSKDFIQFKAELSKEESANDPIKRAAAIKDIVHSIALYPDQITRSIYIKECSQILNIEEQHLLPYLNKALREKSKGQNNASYQEHKEFVQEEKVIPPKPVQQGFYHQEKELLRVLINYGHLHVKLPSEDENAEDSFCNVSELILHTIEHDEIVLQDPLFKLILDEVKLLENLPPQSLVQHQNQEIASTVTDFLYQKHTLSENWQKKMNLYTDDEEKRLEKTVTQTLFSYLLERIFEEIKLLDEHINDIADNDDELMILLHQKQKFNLAKTSFAKQLNRNPILK
jgi:DNA primase